MAADGGGVMTQALIRSSSIFLTGLNEVRFFHLRCLVDDVGHAAAVGPQSQQGHICLDHPMPIAYINVRWCRSVSGCCASRGIIPAKALWVP